jgi:hypothetical protein
VTAAVAGGAERAAASRAGAAVGVARPSTRPSSALTERTGELATVPPRSSTTYRPARPQPPAATPAQEPDAAAAATRGSRAAPALRLEVPQVVDTGAAFMLGLLFWGWVVMPYLRGGQTEVRKVLKAKFLNKSLEGEFLP